VKLAHAVQWFREELKKYDDYNKLHAAKKMAELSNTYLLRITRRNNDLNRKRKHLFTINTIGSWFQK